MPRSSRSGSQTSPGLVTFVCYVMALAPVYNCLSAVDLTDPDALEAFRAACSAADTSPADGVLSYAESKQVFRGIRAVGDPRWTPLDEGAFERVSVHS